MSNTTYQTFRRSWRDQKLLFATPIGALFSLYGFTSTWLWWLGPRASGWEIARGPLGYDLLNFHGMLPEVFLLLWIVPCSALLLLGVGIARLYGFRPRWLRIWSLLLAGSSLAIMGGLCFPLLQTGALQFHFWLTGVCQLVSALGLLLPGLNKRNTSQQGISTDGRLRRRNMLVNTFNLGGLFVVGGAGAWLASVLNARLIKATAHHVTLSIGTYKPLSVSIASNNALAWLPDSIQLVEALGGVLRSWKVTDGQVQRTYALPPASYGVHSNPFQEVSLSLDGRFLAAVLNSGDACVWETSTGQLVQHISFQLQGYNYGCALSPDGTYLATGGHTRDHEALKIWRVSDHALLTAYQAKISQPISVAWSPDGRLVATLEQDVDIFLREGPFVEVWDIHSDRNIFTYNANHQAIGNIAWAPDSRRLAISLSNTLPLDDENIPAPVLIWDVIQNKQVLSCQGHWVGACGLSWSPDGTRLVAGSFDHTAQVWNAKTGERLFIYQGHTAWVTAVAWSPDGKYIASGSRDNTVQIWDAPAL